MFKCVNGLVKMRSLQDGLYEALMPCLVSAFSLQEIQPSISAILKLPHFALLKTKMSLMVWVRQVSRLGWPKIVLEN